MPRHAKTEWSWQALTETRACASVESLNISASNELVPHVVKFRLADVLGICGLPVLCFLDEEPKEKYLSQLASLRNVEQVR
jgi:hypothetical protein